MRTWAAVAATMAFGAAAEGIQAPLAAASDVLYRWSTTLTASPLSTSNSVTVIDLPTSLTAPFASHVHMAPHHYCTGFSRYWYEHHLPLRGFDIRELTPNGDWFAYTEQELMRLGGMERQLGNWTWPLAYAYSLVGVLYFKIRGRKRAEDLACFGWHCIAVKR